ncbi:MAG: hypothetical protein Q3992_00235 [Bacteroides sp.]|nr:hypothetical protein [Bacteroides sp.]
MIDTVIITLLIVAISLILLGVNIFFIKGKKFPNGHVSGNKYLRDKGVGCVQSQDREAQRKPMKGVKQKSC